VRRSTLPHARQQLARIERLGDVVVRADLEAHDPVHDRGGGSHHHDGDVRVALAQVPREGEAVLARHVDVHQRDVDWAFGGDRLRGAGVLGADRRVAVPGKVLLEHLAYVGLVVDDQDCGLRVHAGFLRGCAGEPQE
jgi:hypothetical protein